MGDRPPSLGVEGDSECTSPLKRGGAGTSLHLPLEKHNITKKNSVL